MPVILVAGSFDLLLTCLWWYCSFGVLLLSMSMRYLPAYINQRFPPLAMALFVILFFSVSEVARAEFSLTDGYCLSVVSLGCLATISFFFRLRVMDEIKDLKTDKEVHPDRLVVQGKVRIAELVAISILGLAVELYWSIQQGGNTMIYWLLAVGYSLLMRYEFFIPSWLEKRLLLYALTHTLIMPLVVIWLWSAVSIAPLQISLPLLLLMVVAFFAAMAYEIARKIYGPNAEPLLIPTYSKWLGVNKAAVFSCLLLFVNVLGLAGLLVYFELNLLYLALSFLGLLLVIGVYVKACGVKDEKQFRNAEKLVSLVMVVNYTLLIVLV